MSLADYTPVREVVTFRGGEISVRGLALEDVTILFRAHLTDLDKLFVIFGNNVNPDAAVAEMLQHAVGIVKEAPGLVANLIALASDEPDEVQQAAKLGFSTQVKAIEAIAKLTFEEAGGPKKFVEGLANLLRGLRPPQ